MGENSHSFSKKEVLPLTRLKAKELEEIFINRFEKNFKEFRGFGQILHPTENRFYSASSSSKDPLKSNRYKRVIEVMKKHKIFERSVLEEMPLNEISRFEIYNRSFFGKKTVKIVVAALCLNPLEELVTENTPPKLGLMEVEEAIKSVVREKDVFYYLGIASTCGWEGQVLEQIFKGLNWTAGILEHMESSYWKLMAFDKECWNGMENVYDPELDEEKVIRGKNYLCQHPDLRIRGGHILLDRLYEETEIPDYLFVQALEEALKADGQLEVTDVGGKKILKRKRI